MSTISRLVLMSLAVGVPAVAAAESGSRGLAEFEGHYEYRDGAALFMVADGERLIAIIGEAKYALRAAGPDTFTNAGGGVIPFLCDADPRIIAFQEEGETFARLSPSVSAAARRLLQPRPPGPDGKLATYRYEPPPRLPDAIEVAEAAAGSLPREAAQRLVSGVIDGTYPTCARSSSITTEPCGWRSTSTATTGTRRIRCAH
jgi:hypothetical protein